MNRKKSKRNLIITIIILILLVFIGILIWKLPSLTGKVTDSENWLGPYKVYEERTSKISIEGTTYLVKLIAVNPDNTALISVNNADGKLSGISSLSLNGININPVEIRFYKVSSKNNFVRFKVRKSNTESINLDDFLSDNLQGAYKVSTDVSTPGVYREVDLNDPTKGILIANVGTSWVCYAQFKSGLQEDLNGKLLERNKVWLEIIPKQASGVYFNTFYQHVDPHTGGSESRCVYIAHHPATGSPEFIISNDKDLLFLEQFGQIKIKAGAESGIPTTFENSEAWCTKEIKQKYGCSNSANGPLSDLERFTGNWVEVEIIPK